MHLPFSLLGAKGKCGKSALAKSDSFLMVLSPANKRPAIRWRKQNSSGNNKQLEGSVNSAYCMSTVCSLPCWTLPREGHKRHTDVIFAFCWLRIPKNATVHFTDHPLLHFANTYQCLLWLGTVLEVENSMMKKKDFVPMNYHHENIPFL